MFEYFWIGWRCAPLHRYLNITYADETCSTYYFVPWMKFFFIDSYLIRGKLFEHASEFWFDIRPKIKGKLSVTNNNSFMKTLIVHTISMVFVKLFCKNLAFNVLISSLTFNRIQGKNETFQVIRSIKIKRWKYISINIENVALCSYPTQMLPNHMVF